MHLINQSLSHEHHCDFATLVLMLTNFDHQLMTMTIIIIIFPRSTSGDGDERKRNRMDKHVPETLPVM